MVGQGTDGLVAISAVSAPPSWCPPYELRVNRVAWGSRRKWGWDFCVRYPQDGLWCAWGGWGPHQKVVGGGDEDGFVVR